MAHYLGMELGGITSKRFADGEIYVQIQVWKPVNELMSFLFYACAAGSATNPLF